jgi:serine/threonine protein phosphatase PrpC
MTEQMIADLCIKGLNRSHAPQAFMAVLDGHGGAESADYVKEHLPTHLREHLTKAAAQVYSALHTNMYIPFQMFAAQYAYA